MLYQGTSGLVYSCSDNGMFMAEPLRQEAFKWDSNTHGWGKVGSGLTMTKCIFMVMRLIFDEMKTASCIRAT